MILRTGKSNSRVCGSTVEHSQSRHGSLGGALATCFRTAVSILILFAVTPLSQTRNSCISCHTGLSGSLGVPVQLFKSDIHKDRGLSCNDCHGGDPSKDDKFAAKATVTGYLGTPKGSEILSFCGKCHSDAEVMKRFNPALRVDQVQEYLTSAHGKGLSLGDTKVATCVSCHGIHGIRPATDPLSAVHPLKVGETCAKCHSDQNYIGDYKIGHNHFEDYKRSVHANVLYEKQDLSAPTCNDCHGNHGATPPGVTSIANICGQCHVQQSKLFQASAHKLAFDRIGAHECVQCHSNHAILKTGDHMVGIGKGSVCIDCHSDGKGYEVAKSYQAGLSKLNTEIIKAEEILEEAERAGMEVSKAKFELRGAIDGLTQARVLIHSTSASELNKAIVPGNEIAVASYQAGEAAFAEMGVRRTGLAVSLIFILFLAVLVYLKIRQIEGGGEGSS